MRDMLCPLFHNAARAQPDTVDAGITVEGAALASVLSVVVGTDTLCFGGNDR